MRIISLYLLLFLLISVSCNDRNDKRIVIDFNSPSQDSATISFHEDEAVHVAIASISSPRESYRYYNELLDYIAAKIKIPVHSIQKSSYQEVNQLLGEGVVDFAFISSGAYIEFDETRDISLMVSPVVNQQKHFHAYLITPMHSEIQNLEDLKGKQFVFSDPLSHAGYTYPVSKLISLGEDPQEFFSEVMFSFGHDISIEMVNREVVDGAYVHGMIYDYFLYSNKEKIENTRVIDVSEPFGVPPVVCPKNLDPRRFQLYQEIFLNLHKDPDGKAILDHLNIDRFEKTTDEAYDNVRLIKKKISDENIQAFRIQ